MNTYEDIKALITRLDSIANAPVSEDAEKTKGLLMYFQNKHDEYRKEIIDVEREQGKNNEQIAQALENNDELVELESIVDALKKGDMNAGIEQINKSKFEFSGVPGDDDDFMQVIDKLGIPKDTFWFTKNESVSEDANEQEIIQYAKKYSQYKNLENDNLIEALYNFYLKDGIPQFMFEKGELASAEQKLGKKQDTWTGEEIEEAQKMSPITMGLINDLNKMIPGDSMEEKLEKMRPTLDKAGMLESYKPFPEADEFDINEDEDFEEVLGVLGFPEDEIWEAEYRGRKVSLNKPMRGDVKKFKVYVKDPKTGNVKKVNFGHGGTSAKRPTMRIRKSNPARRRSFRARHNCDNPGPKTKARYWSCRKW